MLFRLRYILVIMIIFTSIVFFWYWRTGAFLSPEGELLVPMSLYLSPITESQADALKGWDMNLKIYSITLSREELNLYFSNEKYSGIRFPTKREEDILFCAKNLANNQYTLIQAKDGTIKEIMTRQTPIYDPVLIHNDTEVIFNSKEGKQYWLVRYNLINKKISKVCEDRSYNLGSCRVSISARGSILLSVMGGIRILHPDDSVENLVEGTYPIWFDEDQSFLYYDPLQESLMIYSITTKEKKRIARNLRISSPLVLSPDKKYVAFFETIPVQPGGDIAKFGEKTILCIITIDGWVKKEIKPYKKDISWSFDDLGFDWIR